MTEDIDKPAVKRVDTAETPESRGVFGKQGEIDRIAKALNKTPMIMLHGPPGIGKSTLIDEVRRNSRHENRNYFRCTVDPHMGLTELYRRLATTLGCQDENPGANFKMLGHYNFSLMAKYAKKSKPTIIHLEEAQYLFHRGQFQDPDVRELLMAILEYYPESRIILESRFSPDNLFPKKIYKPFRIHGLDQETMNAFFERPFVDDLSTGWTNDESQSTMLFKWLTGQITKNKKNGKTGPNEKDNKETQNEVSPLTAVLMAVLASSTAVSPFEIVQQIEANQTNVTDPEVHLFNQLYQEVLSPPQQELLRRCSLYRHGIPFDHLETLAKDINNDDAVSVLKKLHILYMDNENRNYHLHARLWRLTRNKIQKNSREFRDGHEVVAGLWIAQLETQPGEYPQQIHAANEAYYHLENSLAYHRFSQLPPKLLDKSICPRLERISRNLFNNRKHKEKFHVLDLLIKLEPGEARFHRFLGETIEYLKGRGNEEALNHYWTAFEINRSFPPHLADLGRCLMAREHPEIFVSVVDRLDPDVYREVMDKKNQQIYAQCQEIVDRETQDAVWRARQIEGGTRIASFYNDEAGYLFKMGKHGDALAIIEKAEARNCTDYRTFELKVSILEKLGDHTAANAIRNEMAEAAQNVSHSTSIEKESKSPAMQKFINRIISFFSRIGK